MIRETFHGLAPGSGLGNIVAIVALATLVTGCASRPINERITEVDAAAGYRVFPLIAKRPNNDPHTLFVLSFSGGGTRAAAFSYGVLEALRDTPVVVNGQHRRLLDEVDLVTGVSGGSFTALAYAYLGDRLFSEYETRFLKRDVQGTLLRRVINPYYWPRYIGGTAGRTELAEDLYDEILFDGATYADLLEKPAPVAVAAATDLATGARLGFVQGDFDLLCSDLSKMRLARAAATSSAVPVVFSAVTLDNFGGTCGYRNPAWVAAIENPDKRARPSGRAMHRYRMMRDFQDSKERPYIHLVDGGVADNIGVRGVLETIQELGFSAAYRREIGFDQVRRVVVILVNSHSSPRRDWNRKATPPSIVDQLLQASGVPIERYSLETVEAMKDMAEVWQWRRTLEVDSLLLAGVPAAEAEAQASLPRIEFEVLDVNFDEIADPLERQYFLDLPTSFTLPAEAVDRLRALGGQLLKQATEFGVVLRSYAGLPGH